ncbi:MAG: hypothetical protein KDH84_03060, partial [Calditrichaeota bacterium]|nr:hypothetical protein [Calditrichota bacterium]
SRMIRKGIISRPGRLVFTGLEKKIGESQHILVLHFRKFFLYKKAKTDRINNRFIRLSFVIIQPTKHTKQAKCLVR